MTDTAIGIDLGSTTTKAVVMDDARTVLGRGITNSRSNYDTAATVAKTEALLAARFFLFRKELETSRALNGGLDFNFRDNYYLDADNDEHLVQHAVTLVNARIGIADVDDSWELALLGKNLTDETWSPNGTDIPLTDGKFFKLTSPPRSFALQFTVRI